MPKEIEHKFLVNVSKLPRPLPRGVKMVQGYLSSNPTVRVRLISGKKSVAYLTIKGAGLRERDEFEYEIPVAHARTLLKMCGARTLSKVRRRLGGWELDQFTRRHKGMWLAEFELSSRRSKLPKLPEWVGVEVTGDGRYSNSALASQPDKR